MTKKSDGSSKPSTSKKTAPAKKKNSKRPRRAVQVVTCPSDFPTLSPRKSDDTRDTSKRFSQSRRHDDDETSRGNHDSELLLDWNVAAREVKAFASSAFSGKTKRQYKQEEYTRLTGRKMKQQHVPQHIVRGIKKKAKQRMEAQVQEARLNGIVLPTTSSSSRINDGKGKKHNTNYHSGPAPSIGYMKQGVYRVKKRSGNSNKRAKIT